eukprot:PITA_33604
MDIIDKEIVKCIELAKEGLHGVLFVLSIRNRFCEEDANALKSLQKLFGENIMNYVVVIFTVGDDLQENEQTFEEYLRNNKQIEKLLLKCNQRKVIFDNRTTSGTVKEKQVTELLNHIEKIMLQNESLPYSNDMFHQYEEYSNWCENIKSGGYSKQLAEILLREKERIESIMLQNESSHYSSDMFHQFQEYSNWCENIKSGGYSKQQVETLLRQKEREMETMRKIFEQQLADERNARAQSERGLQERIRKLEQKSRPGFSIPVS